MLTLLLGGTTVALATQTIVDLWHNRDTEVWADFIATLAVLGVFVATFN